LVIRELDLGTVSRTTQVGIVGKQRCGETRLAQTLVLRAACGHEAERSRWASPRRV
jgi:hypothetical protein